MIVSGNKTFGIAKALCGYYPDAIFCSRSNGYDLNSTEGQIKFAKLAVKHDYIIINSALWKFNQTILLDCVYKECNLQEVKPHILCIGSTTDRVKNGKIWLYNAEKKALRDYCNTLALNSVWSAGPKITYISFGTLSNNQHKHPDRICIDIDVASRYIKWIIDQPINLNINEISIDPIQIK
jgi:hypothetical protein